jgi:hypothetical protein
MTNQFPAPPTLLPAPPTLRSLRQAAFALALVTLGALPARADIPPSCDAQGALINCAATDVGKPCQGAGKCYEIQCVAGGDGVAKVHKCDVCPTIVATPLIACTINNLGSPCSNGENANATCGAIPSHCNTTTDKFVCRKPSLETPTGPPSGGGGAGGAGATGSAGTTGGAGAAGSAGTGGGGTGASTGSSGGGCDVAPNPSQGMIGIGLVIAGLVFVVVERIRRRKRWR